MELTPEYVACCFLQDVKNSMVDDVLILSGDHLYRMDYMDFVQVPLPTGHWGGAALFSIARWYVRQLIEFSTSACS